MPSYHFKKVDYRNKAKVLGRPDAIREKCFDCVAGVQVEIERCEIYSCSLWPWRSRKSAKNASKRGKRGMVCPHCKANLEGENGYDNRIGVEIPEVYDGALFWMCPECNGKWHRFPKTPQSIGFREKAEPYISGKKKIKG